MFLMIDNYDSFTFNLVHAFGALGAEMTVVRNDAETADELIARKPDAIVISPGPCTPAEAGVSVELVEKAKGEIPMLGVCLGHQAIGAAYGATVVRGPEPVHGKTSPVRHNGSGLFRGLNKPVEATRYHSLVLDRATLPSALVVTADTEDGTIMGMQHAALPLYGVQFHPESIATEQGATLLRNFLEEARG